ncbi:nectin-2-like [Antechinus flavipes]|uniref:nectin-2-like n=1 Tax=Antechinus flavipes TaxID=38775 RepID=UPI002235CB58|nr:nectin-2-like [Antechinus flavipes]
MAQNGSLPSPVLLLLLLLLLPLLRAAPQTPRVSVSPVVSGLLGTTVQLPCHLAPGEDEVQVSQITWLRNGQSSDRLSIAVFHPTHGAGFPSTGPGAERLAFVSQSQGPGSKFHDASLIIQDLRAEDEANYTCEFATFPGGNRKGTTWLRILAKPENRAEAYTVTSGPAPVAVATCVSRGGRPPARISWSPPSVGWSNESRTAGPGPDTFTVTSRLTLIPTAQMNKKKVICRVEHEALGEPARLPVILAVQYAPEVSISSSDEDWSLGQNEASLDCVARSHPPPQAYRWSTASGSLPETALSEGPKLVFRPVDWSANATFVCQVTNAVGTGRASRTVHVREAPSSELSAGPTAAIAVGVIVAVVLVVLAVLAFRLRPCQSCNRNLPEMEVSYASVPSTSNPPRRTQESVADDANANGTVLAE